MGIGGHLEMWQPLEPLLPHRRLIMFDFPGTGASTLPRFPPVMALNALFVRLLIRQLDLRRVDVLGYSWGGLVAQQLAIQHRRSVGRLILACTSFGIGSAPASPRAALRLATRRRYTSPEYFRRIAPTTFGGQFRNDAQLIDDEVHRRVAHPPTRLGYGIQLAASATYYSLPGLPFITAETLVLAGGDDPLIRTINQQLLARLIPQAKLEIVPDAGHLLLLEDPHLAARLIDDFLTTSRA